ncbi:hypothetical protein D3C75_913580 [compost metagenome]
MEIPCRSYYYPADQARFSLFRRRLSGIRKTVSKNSPFFALSTKAPPMTPGLHGPVVIGGFWFVRNLLLYTLQQIVQHLDAFGPGKLLPGSELSVAPALEQACRAGRGYGFLGPAADLTGVGEYLLRLA